MHNEGHLCIGALFQKFGNFCAHMCNFKGLEKQVTSILQFRQIYSNRLLPHFSHQMELQGLMVTIGWRVSGQAFDIVMQNYKARTRHGVCIGGAWKLHDFSIATFKLFPTPQQWQCSASQQCSVMRHVTNGWEIVTSSNCRMQ